MYTGVIIPDLKHFGTVPSLNIFSKIDFNKFYTSDDPPNLKCSADNNCSSWDLPFFISHTNLSNNFRLTNSVSVL
jgi:hypothetical protein